MRIFKIISLLGLVFLFSQCGRTYEGKIEQAHHDGTPKVMSYYATDEPDVLARQKHYYRNGQVRIDGFFKDDKKHGKWTYYYEDGEIWSEGYFKNGKIDGKNKSYHPNGKIAVKGSFDEGTRIGKWYYYKEDGSLEKEIDYDELVP